MPQAPSLSQPPSPLRNHESADDLTAASGRSGPAASATGNLPGGTQVKAQTMRRSELLLRSESPHIQNPVVEIWDSFGDPVRTVEFSGSSYQEALKVNPALRHLDEVHPAVQPHMRDLARLAHRESEILNSPQEPQESKDDLEKIRSQIGELAERSRATQHVLQARSRIGMDHRFDPISPGKNTHRNAGADAMARDWQDNAGRAHIDRIQRGGNCALDFLARAAVPHTPDFWRALTSDELGKTWREAGYHVYEWEPIMEIEDPDSPEGLKQRDADIREEWKEGTHDHDRGATLIRMNEGREWLVWLAHDRTAGYNLSTAQALSGTPSDVYRALEENNPEMLHGLDMIFVAPPSVSNALHALKDIEPQEAHQLLMEHVNDIAGGSVTDIDFDEFGRFMQSRYPRTVVARYDAHALDVEALGAVLDASENRFLLMKMEMDEPAILQEWDVLCFNRPGMKASLDKERMRGEIEDDVGASRSGPPLFQQTNLTPQQYLASARRPVQSRLTRAARISTSSEAARRHPQRSNSRLYSASDYSGIPPKFEMPSATLRRFVETDDQIGIISTGYLRASFSLEEETLARMAASARTSKLVSRFEFAGVRIASPADLVRAVYKTYGVWTEISVEFMKRYVEDQNRALPDNKKIKVMLEVIRPGQALPILGNDPKGYLLQFRQRGQLNNVVFYKKDGNPVFRAMSGLEHYPWELNEVARNEGWQEEGPVSVLHFEGEAVLPLVEAEAPRQESAEDGAVEDGRKRKRAVSTSSMSSDLALRPKPGKAERLDENPASARPRMP
jgi:hypothetical protein